MAQLCLEGKSITQKQPPRVSRSGTFDEAVKSGARHSQASSSNTYPAPLTFSVAETVPPDLALVKWTVWTVIDVGRSLRVHQIAPRPIYKRGRDEKGLPPARQINQCCNVTADPFQVSAIATH